MMSISSVVKYVMTIGMVLLALPVSAELRIKITKGVDVGIPIAVVPFQVSPAQQLPEAIWDIVEADLARSGRFDPISRIDFLNQPHTIGQIQYKNWRLLKANALVIGQVRQLDADLFEVQFRLMDVFRESQLVGSKFKGKASSLRKIAHKISDLIYEKLTGIPGAFDTKIAYVTKSNNGKKAMFQLKVADSDGYRPQLMLESEEPIMSPAWSPQSDKLAYVSFEKKRSMIYVQNLRTGKRQPVAKYPRINSAPAWAPDGQRLAMSLSKDGNAEIYIKDLTSGALTRITRNSSIDTEPTWSPDGRHLLFTSGRSGGRQIYKVSASGGQAQRITFQAKNNGAPSYSPDGKKILLITDLNGGDKVGLYDVATRSITTLTKTRLDDSPSFAPNGDMILYSTLDQGRQVLAAVSVDGSGAQTLRFGSGEVREPAWSAKLP